MIWKIIEMAAIAVECFMVTWFLSSYFPYKAEQYRVLKFFILFVPLFLIDAFGVNELSFLIGFISCEIIFSVIFQKGRIVDKILISCLLYLLFYFVNLPVLHIFGLITRSTSTELAVAEDYRRIAILCITKILYLIITKVVLNICKREAYQFKKNEWIIIISAFVISLTVSFSLHTITEQNRLSEFVLTIVVVLLSAMDMIVFLFMRRLNVANQRETEQKLLTLQIQQQQTEIRQLDQQYQKISIIQHDFQNNVECIRQLIIDGEYQKAIQYADSFSNKSKTAIHPFIHCSSSVINAVVNEKFTYASKYGIKCTCRIIILIPEYLEYDLSIVLSNLLDNAITACKANRSSQIVLILSEVGGYYRVIVKNTISHSVLDNNNMLKTSKKDARNHGWGLRSIKDIAEIHNGSVDIYEKDGMFTVNILLMKDA